jgi:hypothetical protein
MPRKFKGCISHSAYTKKSRSVKAKKRKLLKQIEKMEDELLELRRVKKCGRFKPVGYDD